MISMDMINVTNRFGMGNIVSLQLWIQISLLTGISTMGFFSESFVFNVQYPVFERSCMVFFLILGLVGYNAECCE